MIKLGTTLVLLAGDLIMIVADGGLKIKVGPVKWYKNPAQFQTFTRVDLITLPKSPYVDVSLADVDICFLKDCKERWLVDFLMHTAESIVTPAKGFRDPRTNKRMKIVSWPPTDKEKTIPLVKKIPNGALRTIHFWAYDEWLGQSVIVCDGEESYRLTDPIDLLNLNQENLEILARSQIRVTEKFEFVAKDWTSAVAGVLQNKKKGFCGYKDKLETMEAVKAIKVRRTSMHKPCGRLLEPKGLFIEGYISSGVDYVMFCFVYLGRKYVLWVLLVLSWA
ncbi:hypothetical protein Hanom_Chr05g00430921 [Helianthus anomalus]